MKEKACVTVTRPVLDPEERERRRQAARKALASFYECWLLQQKEKQEEEIA